MIAIGLSSDAELVFRGQTAKRIGNPGFLLRHPLVIAIIQVVEIPWGLLGPLILIGIGVIILVKTFYLGDE